MKARLLKAYRFLFVKYRRLSLGVLGGLLLAYAFCLPRPLFKSPTCMVLEDSKGDLLGAGIAADGQWRFPYSDDIPPKFEQCILEFEDRRFHRHWGIDPVGIGRAVSQNIRNADIVSGGSTITMQVIRMARGDRRRNLFNKALEAIMATRMEITYSKKGILALYASNAPFGGNVVGLDAAAWRYYGKRPDLLSWGEAATLAVLPNSPALIHPGRNRNALLAKRNRLLDRLLSRGNLDSLSCRLAKDEPLPDKPLPLPRLAPHLLDRAAADYISRKGAPRRVRSTLNRFFQTQTNNILLRHKGRLAANGIHNACVVVMDVETGDILAYVGNMPDIAEKHSPSVDIIQAPRSTGSILKPVLYAAMLDEGSLLPKSLLPDVPTQMGTYRPLNYYETYDGAVPADRALSRSLNVPAIRMLQRYGTEKFRLKLRQLGMTTLDRPASHYGLTLIVGGAEGNLFEITNMYACMARSLNHFHDNDGKYDPVDFRYPNYIFGNKKERTPYRKLRKEPIVLSTAAIWQTFEAMRKVERPTSEGDWEIFESDWPVAWKTGTSFGFRDAWAVGVNPRYAVGVWTGNADGEGRPGLVGVHASAPILFDVFDFLSGEAEWFDKPEDEMADIAVCRRSGHLALPHCEPVDTLRIPLQGERSKGCPFHQTIHLDDEGQRVNTSCVKPHMMRRASWFVLPPLEEFYYKSKNPNYIQMPPLRADCASESAREELPMQMIYPKFAAKIYVPVGFDGKRQESIFRAAHRRHNAMIHWHLDNEYLGSTETFHEMALDPPKGPHQLTLVDDDGHRLEVGFEVLEK